jgi:hypothetical protein
VSAHVENSTLVYSSHIIHICALTESLLSLLATVVLPPGVGPRKPRQQTSKFGFSPLQWGFLIHTFVYVGVDVVCMGNAFFVRLALLVVAAKF